MKLFGSLSELVSAILKKNGFDLTIRPNNSITYTGARTIDTPPQDANSVLVSENASQALTNKTFDADLNTVSNIDNADIKAAAGIVYSKLNLSNSIVNADVASGAAIALNKLAALPVSEAVVTNGSGVLTTVTGVSATEVGYLSSVTSDIQTQLDNKQPLDAELTSLAALATNGLVTRTAAGTINARSVASGSGISVTNGDGVAGNPTVAIDSTVATLTGSQTLTNKTLQEDVIDNWVDINHETTPAAPAAGKVRVYSKNDNLLYVQNSAGVEYSLSAGTTSFADNSFEVYDNLDNTKKLSFQVSGVTTGTTRTLTIPNASGTIALRDANNTWSGTQDFSGALVTLPTSATTINGLFFSLAGPGDITLTSTAPTNVTLPASGTLASLAGTQTFSNKTFSDRVDITEVAAPAAPGAGVVRTWAGTDSQLKFLTDTNVGEVLETQKVFNYLAKWQTANEDIGTVVSGLTATGNRTTNQTQWGSTNTANLTIRRLSDILAIRNSGYIYELYSPSSSTASGLFIESPMFDIATEDLTNPSRVFLRAVGNVLGHWDIQLIRYNSSGTFISANNLRGGEVTGMGSAGLPTGSNSATFDTGTNLNWSAGDKAAIRFRRTNANTTIYIKDLQATANEVGFATTVTASLSPIALGTTFVDLTSFTLEPGTWIISLRGNMIVTSAQRNTVFIADQSGTNTGLSNYVGVGDTRFCSTSYDPNTNNVVQLTHPGLIVHVSQAPKTFYLKWQRYGNSIELFSGETHITVRRIG